MSSVQTPHTPENWGAASRAYAEKVAPFMMQSFAEAHVERLNIDFTSEVLEVGAGSGALTGALARQARSVLATDFAPGMIDVLKEQMDRAGVGNVQYAVMDGQALDLDDDSFDAAASSFTLMFFPDRARGFSELCRVVRPGGRAVVSGWATPDKFEGYGLFRQAMQRAFPDLPPPPAPPPVFSLANPDDFKAQMEAGGFRDVEVEFVARDLEVDSTDDVWGIMTVGSPPMEAALNRIGPGGRDKLRASVAEVVRERFGSGPIRVTNVATIGSGVAS